MSRSSIPTRNVKFPNGAERARLPFSNGNVVVNTMFAVLSASFPDGERFFVNSVRRFQARITDPELRGEVGGFVAQEAIHGREHDRLNAWFTERDVDVDTQVRRIRWSLGQLERLSPRQQLACTAALEHFTAALAESWLTNEEFHKTSDPEAIQMWLWHALEELEHKTVAYDVFQAVGGTQRERKLAAAACIAAILPGIIASWFTLIAREGRLRDVREHIRGFRTAFGENGIFTPVIAQMPVYVAKRFHPGKRDTSELTEMWRERLFGDRGSASQHRAPARAA